MPYIWIKQTFIIQLGSTEEAITFSLAHFSIGSNPKDLILVKLNHFESHSLFVFLQSSHLFCLMSCCKHRDHVMHYCLGEPQECAQCMCMYILDCINFVYRLCVTAIYYGKVQTSCLAILNRKLGYIIMHIDNHAVILL